MPGLTPQQEEAVLSIDQNVLVSAGAGSGKTHVLVERYLELLRLKSELTVDSIIAVTFTRKAAGEMRTRLKARFKDLSLSDPENAERWRQCLSEIDSARIGTIHSLCESILKAFPVESSIDPQFEVLDDVAQAELLEKSVNEAFRLVIAEDRAEKKLLLDFNIEDVRRWLASILKSSLQFRESQRRIMSFDDKDLLTYMNTVRHRLQLKLIFEITSSTVWIGARDALKQLSWQDKLEDLRLDVLSRISLIESLFESSQAKDDLQATAQAWQQLENLTTIALRIGGNKEGAKEIKAHLKILRDSARAVVKDLPATISEDDLGAFEYCLMIVSFFDLVDSIYTQKKQAELKLDFNDLISLTHATLNRAESAARSFYQDRLHAILVDEFQDTNSVQAALIGALAGPQTRLFLIGDDKQSIYKFQGADVSTFNAWRRYLSGKTDLEANEIGSLKLSGAKKSLMLNVSFRSHPKIVDFVNFVFDKLLPETDTDMSYSAIFEPLQASRQAASVGESEKNGSENIDVILYESIDENGRRDAQSAKDIEGNSLADWILEKVEAKTPITNATGEIERYLKFSDFAVLVPRNKDFAAIEKALAARNIPFTTFAGQGFLNRQEILDMENLLYFLGNPLDSHSLLGAIRSPMFALSDDIIHEVVTGANGVDLWSALRDRQLRKRPGYESLRKAVTLLGHLLDDARRLPTSELLRRIIERTNYELVLSSQPKGVQRARNLWKLIAVARDQENLSCLDFARRLSLMREYSIKQSDAPLGTSDSVKLMTVHASKGLEFEAVALPALSGVFQASRASLLFHPSYGIAFNTKRGDEEEEPAWYQYASRLDAEMELAERKRLLYVATTRAREYLGLFLDRDGFDRVSFRTWLIDVLELDMDESSKPDLPVTRVLRARHGNAEFRVINKSHKSRIAMSEEATSTVNEPVSSFELPRLNQIIIDELPYNDEDLKSDIDSRLRITPKKGESEILDPTQLGTFFHSLMENLPVFEDKPSRRFVEDLAFDMGVMVSHPLKLARLVEEGEALLSIYMKSDLRFVVMSARRKFNEIPYLMANVGKLNSRRPDLVIEDRSGSWYVIDYKTDDFDIADIANQSKKHRGQLAAYAEDLKALTGFDFSPAVYFARHGKTIVLDGRQFPSLGDLVASESDREVDNSAELVQLKLDLS